MRLLVSSVFFAVLSTQALAGDLQASSRTVEEAPELTCVLSVDEDGYESVVCGEVVDLGDLGGSSERITLRECLRAGGTPAQPYTSHGDYGWYCVNAYLGAPPRL